MKRILQTVGILLVCGMLCIPQVDARGRNNSGGGNTTHKPASTPTKNTTSRPGNQGTRPGNQSNSSRPGNQSNSSRPGSQSNTKPNNTRPGNNKPNNTKPTNNRPGNNAGNNGTRPGGPGANNGRPGTPPPAPKPQGHGPGNDWHHQPPRPNLPSPCPYHRPVPPPSYQYTGGWPAFNTILGITIGTTLNLSVNTLINSGYAVTGYGDNMVYLTNVSMLNLIWPDATLYYASNGGLAGSQFIYSTPGYNMSRYNLVYSDLVRTYGVPVSVENLSNGVVTTWFGSGSQYIQLSYQSQYAVNGGLRYYTTLSFGN